MLSRPHRLSAGLLITFPLLLTLLVAAPAAAKNPPGNNGTIKVDTATLDTDPGNEPHVDCQFQIDFYGFDQGPNINAAVTFEAHPPTGTGVLLTDTVWIGEDGGGGATDLDAQRSYNLTTLLAGYPVHAQQGHHVKLTIHAEGSQGAKTKHKVFWVGPCQTTLVPPPPPPPSSPPPSSPPPSTPQGGGSGTQGNVPQRSGTASSSGGSGLVLPDTSMAGSTSGGLLLAGLVIASGAALSVAAIRSEARTRRR